MPDLFLIRQPNDVAMLFRPSGDRTWVLSRAPPVHRDKVKITLYHGPEGWVVQDCTSAAHGAVLYRPAGTTRAAEQAPDGPPLGRWRHRHGDECALTDVEPNLPPLGDPNFLDAPFADVVIQEHGDIIQVNGALRRTPITDDTLERLLARFHEFLLRLVRRPRVILMLNFSLQDAAVPAMRHVKRFMAFVGEHGWALDLLVRGAAIAIRPQGLTGMAVFNIVKMVLRLLPAPWQTSIVPSLEDAQAFLVRVAAIEAQVLAAEPNPDEEGEEAAPGAPATPASGRGRGAPPPAVAAEEEAPGFPALLLLAAAKGPSARSTPEEEAGVVVEAERPPEPLLEATQVQSSCGFGPCMLWGCGR